MLTSTDRYVAEGKDTGTGWGEGDEEVMTLQAKAV